MRDVSHKPNSLRTATAESTLRCGTATIAAIRSGNLPKADPIPIARVAGIHAAKNTSLLIAYCHQVPLDFVGVDITLRSDTIHISSTVKAVWKTGVEMEALVAASAAALALYDMLKIIDDTMVIEGIRLLDKKGGKSDLQISSDRKIRAGVLVLSDAGAQGEREDRSGKAIRERLESFGVAVPEYAILPDDHDRIVAHLQQWADTLSLDVVITSGGTGMSPRDVTPDATKKVIDSELPGVVEILRAHGQERNRHAMLSRGIAGVRGTTVIVNLPGSTAAVNESLDVLLPWLLHSHEILRGGGH